MSKLIYLQEYYTRLCMKYNSDYIGNQEALNTFIFNANEKGTLYARYKLLNTLKQ